MELSHRHRRLAGTWLTVALVALGLGAAYRAEGRRATNTDLHDAGVWVTRGETDLARLNTEIDQLEVRVRTTSADSLWQWNKDVLVYDSASAQLTVIDTAKGETTSPIALRPQSAFAMGAGVGAVLDRAAGRLIVDDVAALVQNPQIAAPPPSAASTTTTRAEGDRNAEKAPPNAASAQVVVVSRDGVAFALAPDLGVVYSMKAGRAEPDVAHLERPVTKASMTVVGDRPVVLDNERLELSVPGQRSVDLRNLGAGLVLQQPGPAADVVLIASDTGLHAVAMGDGTIETLHKADRQKDAVAPVALGGCFFAAWSTVAPARVEICGEHPVVTLLPADRPMRLSFRVNRDRVVLNDVLSGRSWNRPADDGSMRPIENWNDVEVPPTTSRPPQPPDSLSGGGNLGGADCRPASEGTGGAPQAHDTTFSVRPGRPRMIRTDEFAVDPDCGVLTIAGRPSASAGVLAEIADEGGALQVSASQPGTYTVGVRVADGTTAAVSGPATLTINVVGADANQAPKPEKDLVMLESGRTVTIDVLENDIDPEGDALVLDAITSTDNDLRDGSQFEPTGLLTVRAPNTVGKHTITYTVVDEQGAPADGTVEVDVSPPGRNLEPVARNELLRVLVGRDALVDLLANDFDGNGDPLSVMQIENAPDGKAVVTLEAERYLRIAAVAVGSFELRYVVTDANAVEKEPARALVRVDIVAPPQDQTPPVAVRDDVIVRPGVAKTVDVLANDFDADGDVVMLRSVSGAPPGMTVAPVELHKVRIVAPASLERPAVLTYTVSDGTADATGIIVVRPYTKSQVNQPPVAGADLARVRVNNTVSVPVLLNDADPDGDDLLLAGVEPLDAAEGAASVQDGSITFRAPAVAKSAVRVRYILADSAGNKVTGTIAVRVLPDDAASNAPPRPRPVTVRVIAGHEAQITLPYAAMDPEGDIVTFRQIVRQPSSGSVTTNDDGTLTYSTAVTARGQDVFTYEVQDSYGAKGTGTVLVGIVPPAPANSPPVAVADAVTMKVNAERRVAVLANDTDIDGDTLALIDEADALSQPRSGRAARDPNDATVVVVNAGSSAGSYSFDYLVGDGKGGRARGVVTVTVAEEPTLRPPVARDDVVLPVKANTSVDIEVLRNDEDPDGDLATVQIRLDGVDPGRAVVDGQKVRATPGTEALTFGYTITSKTGLSASATVRVPVAQNLPPRTNPDRVTTPFATPVTIDVLANDTDPEGQPLRLTRIVDQRNGDAAITDGKVTFTPVSTDHRPDASFTYEVTDGELTATGLASITVLARDNRPPVMTTVRLEVPAGTTRSVDLTTSITDPDTGDRPQVVELAGAANGLTVTRSGNVVQATAGQGTRGNRAVITVTLDDGKPKGRVTGTLELVAIGSDKALPVAVDDTARTNQSQSHTIDVTVNDTDPEGNGLTVVSTGGQPAGTVTTDGRSVTFQPDDSFFGTTSFTYTVEDSQRDADRRATGTVRVTVVGLPSATAAPTIARENRACLVTWSAPPMNGGVFDRYEIESVPLVGSGERATGTSVRYGGLTNGLTYQFRVRAVNSAGAARNWSALSPACVPDVLPAIPTAPQLVYGDRQLTVNWTPPANEGTPITRYDLLVSGAPSPIAVGGSATTHVISGLTNGTAYTVRLRATNAAGNTEYSPASAPETPSGLPVAAAPSAVPGDRQCTVSWPAAQPNGAPVLEYRVSTTGQSVLHGNMSSLSTLITGLMNGTDYTFTIEARNRSGWSRPSGISPPCRPFAPPTATATPVASPGVGSATIRFLTPFDNGRPIAYAELQVSGGLSGTRTPVTMDPTLDAVNYYTYGGLPNGQSFQFRVRACNNQTPANCGAWSSLSAVVRTPNSPAAPAFTNLSARGPNTVDVAWNAPADNGSPILQYEVFRNAGLVYSGSANSFTDTGAPAGSTVTYRVHARNAVGWGGDGTGQVNTPSPPPVRTVTISKYGNAQGETNCSSSACRYIAVSLSGFSGTRFSLECWESPGGRFLGPSQANFPITDAWCYYGVPGNQVWVVVDGVESNHITW